ncbi:glycoside hydrolase family 10 protein [Bergeyella sp. RCAD1439]|uniref:glycoside hydrolase family 10 protein n=1 Tax=Bergeyella anatis TaxID=3113737 RepID=UPI002E185293|nr:family 10 glycosylhydrolase [Bergeyella sp. RCAD1439]
MKICNRKTVAFLLASALGVSCGTPRKGSEVAKPSSAYQTTSVVPSEAAKPQPQAKTDVLANLKLPEVRREFRAAWVATVANINWPSKNTLSTEEQKAEAIEILDKLKAANFNAVIFQARPSADAFYKSDLEPWSYFLTGEVGRAPYPYYDPLAFWIEQAHLRGMELHVWLNPYRAHHTSGGAVTEQSMAKKMGEATYKLRNGMYWMDPSDAKVQDHASAVIRDLVRRYDIDAVHIDDYFYPYKEYNGGRDFPDTRTWEVYSKSGGTLSRADWRRANVNKFIKRIHEEIKAEKPYVKFGISPFGIWKSGYPQGTTGLSQYDELYADAKLWLNEGWCDYYSPQLYWKEGGGQSFSALLKWWQQENYKNVHLWPGLNTVGIRGVSDKTAEIVGQIQTTRELVPRSCGAVHYSMDGISKNPSMFAALQELYKEKALVPASPWIKTSAVLKPEITAKKQGASVHVSWLSRDEAQVRHWILYAQYGTHWETELLDRVVDTRLLPMTKSGQTLKVVALRAVDRLSNESDYAALKVSN